MPTVIDKITNKQIKIKDRLTTVDKDWLRNSHLVDMTNLESANKPNAFWSNAYLKYTDTSIGGNFGINTRYGFTPSADPAIAGRLSGRDEYTAYSDTMNYGMGRRYSEMFDDNEEILWLELGDKKFNSLLSYITHAVDYGTLIVATSGRSLAAYYAGKAIFGLAGTAALFVAFPAYGVLGFLAAKLAVDLLINSSDFSYYKLEPNMTKYWRGVNSLATQLFVEMGIVNPEVSPDTGGENIQGMPVKFTSEFSDVINELYPGLLTEENAIDVFAIANRTQILHNEQLERERNYYENADNVSYDSTDVIPSVEPRPINDYLKRLLNDYNGTSDKIIEELPKDDKDFQAVTKAVKPTKYNSAAELAEDQLYRYEKRSDTWIEEKNSWTNDFMKYAKASAMYGSAYATFRVEYVGSTTETFSTTTQEIPLKSVLNGATKKVKELKFSAGGGNLFGDVITQGVNYLGDFLFGGLEVLTFGLSNVVATAIQGGYYDIPDMVADSSFEGQKHTFKMRLGGPYGHPLCLGTDIGIPLIMLVQAIAAQSAGKAAYADPMLCSAFIRGKLNGDLMVMDSLTIERGTSAMGYDAHGRALAVDVTFSFVDLTSFPTASVDASLFGPFSSTLDDSKPSNKYLQMLGGRSIYTNKFQFPKLKLKYQKLRQNTEALLSPKYWGTMVGETIGNSPIGGLLDGFSLPDREK